MWGLFKKVSPITIEPGEFQGLYQQVQDLADVLKSIIEDQATFNTAINRIERKQNRWLDLLNIKDDSRQVDQASPTPAQVAGDNGNAGLPGDEEEA